MRAFVLMVLVLNVVFFAWQFLADKLESQVSDGAMLLPVVEESAAPSLALVSEVPPTIVVEEPVVLVEASSELVAVEPQLVDVAVSESEPESSLAASIEVEEVVVPPLVAICYSVGPFGQRAEPDELVAMVEQYDFDVAITDREVEKLLGEWVYLVEYGSVQAARDDVKALKAQGIVDVAVARLEDDQLIISLGIFGQQESLARRLLELKALGYVNYQTKERFHLVREYWLVLSGFEGGQQRILADELGVVLSDRFPAAQLTSVGCR